MQAQTAVVVGATGLIGSEVVKLLLNDNSFSEVRLLVRRPLSLSHPKLRIQLVDFDNYFDIKKKMSSGHSVFCCVGTTQKKVKGDLNAYRKVDYDIPVNTANAAIENGFKNYLLVSSVGANEKSKNFYLQLKGSVEVAVSKLDFQSVYFFRPSLLLGERSEFRLGEKVAQTIMSTFSFVLVGGSRKYKPIHCNDG